MKSKFWILIFLLFLSGCASVPVREGIMVYDINGAQYFSLGAICGLGGMTYDYDTFTQTATLAKDAHAIKLKVGDGLLLVDGRPTRIKYPVDLYNGMLVVPEQFKSQIVDALFVKERPVRRQSVSVAKIKRVVIDAGHGGADPGAIGRTGLQEKSVNLDVAGRLRDILGSEGIDVVLTRANDKFIPLPRRSEIANNCKADLFISIHSNANNSRALNGFEVYYVSPTVDDYKRALNAVRNAALDMDAASFASSSPTLKAILWDMIYTANRAESVQLSGDICRSIDNKLDTAVRGVKGARYEVLKGTRVPAILIEIGFLSNAREELLLRSGDYRQKMADAIASGILNYAKELRVTEAVER